MLIVCKSANQVPKGRRERLLYTTYQLLSISLKYMANEVNNLSGSQALHYWVYKIFFCNSVIIDCVLSSVKLLRHILRAPSKYYKSNDQP